MKTLTNYRPLPLVLDFPLLTFGERVRHVGDELPFAVPVALPDVGEVALLRVVPAVFPVLELVATVRVSELARGRDAPVDAFPHDDGELRAIEIVADGFFPQHGKCLHPMKARVLPDGAQITVAHPLANQSLAEAVFEAQDLRASFCRVSRRGRFGRFL